MMHIAAINRKATYAPAMMAPQSCKTDLPETIKRVSSTETSAWTLMQYDITENDNSASRDGSSKNLSMPLLVAFSNSFHVNGSVITNSSEIFRNTATNASSSFAE